ncbi:DNA/RNA non-specific endonuclease [Phenylobacterium sp.]|uniref:DNA/RNA non-specific endonuclease n=1 Tax=Phenylobacterium sp. TaxID=1871053 RepID=UPI0025D337A7|nr:DNA/RNA non-specific endonuclease [Phenylobacterium sp.]
MIRAAGLRAAVAVIALAVLVGPAGAQAPSAPQPAAQDPRQLLACLARFNAIGVPLLRSEEARADQFARVICRRGYALSFDVRTLNPSWVIERLTPEALKGSAVRSNRFLADPILGGVSPVADDYTGSGFDRGHQAPAADSRFDQQVMNESFYMSNMSPQVGIGFNRGQWKYLEEAVRAWVLCGGHDDVIVMTGPVYGDSAKTISARKIVVPEAYYKIVYDVRAGRAVGFRLQNSKHKKSDLQSFVVPISEIEDETGIDFFPALTRRRQNQLETPRGIVWGHDQGCTSVSE